MSRQNSNDVQSMRAMIDGHQIDLQGVGNATRPFEDIKVMLCRGMQGTGIESIEKTSTVGLVDTYTITYTNGDTDTFTVTNGRDGKDSSDLIGDTFSDATSYAVGNLVIYSGHLYRFTSAHQGAWDAADVVQTTVDDELSGKLGKNEKAASATTADSATTAGSATTAASATTAGNVGHYFKVIDADGVARSTFNGSANCGLQFLRKVVSVPSTGWSSIVDADGYYFQTVSLGAYYNGDTIPNVYLRGSTSSTLPTAAEQAAYALVDKITIDEGNSSNTINVYAKTKPTTTFYIEVEGVRMY